MEISVKYLRVLLEKLAEKTGETMDTKGFREMSDQVGSDVLTGRYLQERIYNRIKNKEGSMRVHPAKIDAVAKFLNYSNINEFIKSIDAPVPELLANCLGMWYSYVRTNSGNPEILRAPVSITAEKNVVKMKLLGRERVFEGEVKGRSGNVYATLDNSEDKSLTIIMKIGISKNPAVLQGVFAGISNNGDPICGREVFIRQETEDINDLNWNKIQMDNVLQDTSTDKRIIEYFADYQKNCIKINKVSNFDMEDLIT